MQNSRKSTGTAKTTPGQAATTAHHRAIVAEKAKPSPLLERTLLRRAAPAEPLQRTAAIDLDSIDLALIEELQENARTSFAELARRVHLSTPAVIDRVHRMEASGVILRYRAEINPAALGLHVRAFVKVTVAGDRLGSFSRIVREIPEILECHRVTGNESYIVQVAVRDMNHLEAVIDSMMPYVATNTSMVLNSPVESARIAPHTGVSPVPTTRRGKR